MMRSRGRTRTPNITTDQQERRNISPQAHKVHANITNVASDNTQIQHGSHKFVIRDTIKVHPGLCLDGTQEIEPMTTWMRGHSHDQLRQPAVMLSTKSQLIYRKRSLCPRLHWLSLSCSRWVVGCSSWHAMVHTSCFDMWHQIFT